MPVLLAVYAKWSRKHADKLLVKLAKWSVRAQIAGALGGGTADEVFGAAAAAVSKGDASNQTEVRALLQRLIPGNDEFREAFVNYGDVSSQRAKYLLAMLEKAEAARVGLPEPALDWQARTVTIEHILPKARAASNPADALVVNKIGNVALLEKKLNKDLGSKGFTEKRAIYKTSSYALTTKLASRRTWGTRQISDRTKALADLACTAWPDN